MKPYTFSMVLLGVFTVLFLFVRCDKENDDADRFELLTTPVWVADSLLSDGLDASGPGQPLEKFKGEARFNKDYSGTFGEYSGTWRFQTKQTEIVITTDAHPIPITTRIEELTERSLKITTRFIDPEAGTSQDIRMTFKVR